MSPDLSALKQQLNAPFDFENLMVDSKMKSFDNGSHSFHGMSNKKNLKSSAYFNNFQLTSNYWKLDKSITSNDDLNSLTSFSLHESKPLISIGSNGNDSNLMICNLDLNKNLLTHTQSISLPNIYSMKWLYDVNLNKDNYQEDDFSFLLTGHSNGYVHLTLVPDLLQNAYSSSDEDKSSAEIIKRFNHSKHVQNDYDLSYKNPNSTTISCLNITPKTWRSANKNSLITCYQENIFLWESSRSSVPILKSKAKGINYFDPSTHRDGLLALSGEFGVCLFDMRVGNNQIGSGSNGTLCSSYYLPHKSNNKKTTICKWSPFNSNLLATAEAASGIVKVWDVRKGEAVGSLSGHCDSISSLQWSTLNPNDLYSGSEDGNIIHWNLSNIDNSSIFEGKEYTFQECRVRKESRVFQFSNNGLSSSSLASTDKNIHLSKNQIKYSRECGTSIPASNSGIVDLIPIGKENTAKGDIISIDNSLFLGIHGIQAKPESKSKSKLTSSRKVSTRLSDLVQEESRKSLDDFKADDILFTTKPHSISANETNIYNTNESTESLVLSSSSDDEDLLANHSKASRRSSNETLFESLNNKDISMTADHQAKTKPSFPDSASTLASPYSPKSSSKFKKIMKATINSESTLVNIDSDDSEYNSTPSKRVSGKNLTNSNVLGDFKLLEGEIDSILNQMNIKKINHNIYI